MTFNELKSVEHFIIHQLSGTNLNKPGQVAEDFSPRCIGNRNDKLCSTLSFRRAHPFCHFDECAPFCHFDERSEEKSLALEERFLACPFSEGTTSWGACASK